MTVDTIQFLRGLHFRFESERRELLMNRHLSGRLIPTLKVNSLPAMVAVDRLSSGVEVCRPRGWNQTEASLEFEGQPMSASLYDFGLYFFNNAHVQYFRGTGPYLVLPPETSPTEIYLWRDVFTYAQEYLELPIEFKDHVMVDQPTWLNINGLGSQTTTTL